MSILGEGSLFTPKSVPLLELLPGIHNHKIALPNFQRPWRWEPERVRELIISVAYRYPAGSLLTMPVISNSFALRSFQGSGDKLKDNPNLMVLDGQQRLTSLYQALFVRHGVEFRKRRYHLYLDVPHLMSDPDGSIEIGDPFFEDALFFVLQEKDGQKFRYEGLKKMYSLTKPEDEMAHGALPLWSIFDPDGYLSDWKTNFLIDQSHEDMKLYVKLQKTWDNLVQPWIDRIRNYPFPVVELRADMPLSAICHIFEKVNSQGLPLDVFDLCTAILWAQGFFLNDKWNEQIKEFRDQNLFLMQPLNGTAFMQSIALLASMDRKRANPGERLAVACRKRNLMELDRSTVEHYWDILVNGYKEASIFMMDQGILSEKILPYTTMIIPLSAIFADIRNRKGEVGAKAAWPKIKRWYWCSVFSQRYSGPVETYSALDFEQLVGWVNDGAEPDAVRTFIFRSDSLQEISSIRNAMYKGVLCLLAQNGAQDFSGGGGLNAILFHDSGQDHHHIFPWNALSHLPAPIKDPRADSIINKTLISAAANRSISGKFPSKYVAEWRSNIGAEQYDRILESHEINPEYLSKDKWNDFILDRRERLKKLIESVCGGDFQPFSDDYLPIEDQSIEDDDQNS